jgi:L-ribulose-5-phosphate 3-epimerase UlaE
MAHARLGLYEKAMPSTLSLPEALVAAGEAGFDFFELSIDENEGRLVRLSCSAIPGGRYFRRRGLAPG